MPARPCCNTAGMQFAGMSADQQPLLWLASIVLSHAPRLPENLRHHPLLTDGRKPVKTLEPFLGCHLSGTHARILSARSCRAKCVAPKWGSRRPGTPPGLIRSCCPPAGRDTRAGGFGPHRSRPRLSGLLWASWRSSRRPPLFARQPGDHQLGHGNAIRRGHVRDYHPALVFGQVGQQVGDHFKAGVPIGGFRPRGTWARICPIRAGWCGLWPRFWPR